MTYRVTLEKRKWLENKEYDLLTLATILHYDLFAYRDTRSGEYWFLIEARQSGKILHGVDIYVLMDGMLEHRHAAPWDALTPVAWTREANATFRHVHKALLTRCILLPEFTRVSTHCHYITVHDSNPWPRGWVNGFRYTIRDDDPRRLPRTRRALPDIL